MRPTVTIIVLFALQNIGSAQLIRPAHERPAKDIEFASKVPAEVAQEVSLTFQRLVVIFDGGSYGAVFRRADAQDLVIFFLHPGYWTRQAIEKKTQPIVVELSRRGKDDVKLEVEHNSPFERRLIELLTNDLVNKAHSREEIKTLTRVRDCVQSRNPLREIRKRFPGAFTDK